MLPRQIARAIRIFAPFVLLLLISLLALVLSRPASVTTEPPSLPPFTVVEATITVAPAVTAAAVEQPIVESSITPESTPALPPGPLVTLIGPPDASAVPVDATISFFWQADYDLRPDQMFAVELDSQPAPLRLGTVGEPNLGRAYQLAVDLDGIQITPGPYAWRVHLLDSRGSSLWQSEARSLMLQ